MSKKKKLTLETKGTFTLKGNQYYLVYEEVQDEKVNSNNCEAKRKNILDLTKWWSKNASSI